MTATVATVTTRSTIHSIRLAVARRIASDYLAENDGISLGLFLDYLRKPEIDRAIIARLEAMFPAAESRTAAREYADIFKDATKQEMDALYEPLLNFLEVVHGPLECDAPGQTGRPKRWGYAGLVSLVDVGSLNPSETIDLWTRRARSLREGHPDQRCWNNRRAPHTFWRRAKRTPARPINPYPSSR